MCSLVPCAAAPGFGAAASAFLDGRRGVAALALASFSEGKIGGEPMRRARAAEVSSTAPAQKRGRHDCAGSDVASSALRIRMDAELVALHGILKKAKLLPPSAPSAEKKCAPAAAPRRSEAPVVKLSAAKSAALSQSQRKAATAAAYQYRQTPITPPAAKNSTKQQERPVPRAAKQQRCPVQRVEAKTEAPKKQQPEEIARAREREEFRRMVQEMEKSALPDETIYPEDLEELGLPLEFLVTRTWKQAWLEDNARNWSS